MIDKCGVDNKRFDCKKKKEKREYVTNDDGVRIQANKQNVCNIYCLHINTLLEGLRDRSCLISTTHYTWRSPKYLDVSCHYSCKFVVALSSFTNSQFSDINIQNFERNPLQNECQSSLCRQHREMEN